MSELKKKKATTVKRDAEEGAKTGKSAQVSVKGSKNESFSVADRGNGMHKMLSQLREQAEKMIEGHVTTKDLPMSKNEMKGIFHELHVQQQELEMQNNELQIANEELQIKHTKFAGIYDLAPLGYFILDKTGIVEEVNSKGLTLLGIQRDVLIKRRFQSFIVPEDLERFYNFQKRMVDTQIPQSCHLKLLSHNKKIIYAQLEGTAVSNMPQSATQCYIAVIDITKRVETETNLVNTNERLELALEASSAGTWEIDMNTGYFFLDNANHELCGLKHGAFDGNYDSFINLIHPDDRNRVDEHFRDSLNNEKEIDIDFKIVKAQNTACFVAVRGHVVAGPGQDKRFVGTMMNITDKKSLEEETNKLTFNQQRNITAAILLAQENERRRISEALHDSVSQLLYGIKLNLQQLNSDIKLASTHFEKIKGLIDAAINEARNISFELAPSILTDFGLPATINEMAKRLSTKLLSIRVSVHLNERLPLSLEINIFRILQELINNCIKHSGADIVTLAIKKEDNSILIRVRDNGKGFNEKQKPGGSGLSSIRNRLSLYSGTFELESKPGRGTTVYVAIKNPAEIT